MQARFPSETVITVAGGSGFDSITCSEMLEGMLDAVSKTLNKCLNGNVAVVLSNSWIPPNREIVGPQSMVREPEEEVAVTFRSTKVRWIMSSSLPNGKQFSTNCRPNWSVPSNEQFSP